MYVTADLPRYVIVEQSYSPGKISEYRCAGGAGDLRAATAIARRAVEQAPWPSNRWVSAYVMPARDWTALAGDGYRARAALAASEYVTAEAVGRLAAVTAAFRRPWLRCVEYEPGTWRMRVHHRASQS